MSFFCSELKLTSTGAFRWGLHGRCFVLGLAQGRGGTTELRVLCLIGLLMLAGWWRAMAGPVWVDAITEPIKDITMAFPVIGVVGARPLEDGSPVKPGQLVIELDKRLEELDVERRRLARDLAKNELDRLKSLAQRNAISVSPEELDKKQAEYDVARVEWELAQEVLRRRQLVSPIEGYIVQFFKDIGEKCEEQQPVVRLADTRRCYCVANIAAQAGSKLKIGQMLTIEIDSGSGTIRRQGTVSYISPVVDPASGLLRIKLVFDNSDGAIRPGVAGRLQLSE